MKSFLASITTALILSGFILATDAFAGEKKMHAPMVKSAKASPFPASLVVAKKGYPKANSPCRQLGESAATSNFLSESAKLVGCPTKASAKALHGKIVGMVGKITLVSVPDRSTKAPEKNIQDAKVLGTKFDATTAVTCTGYLKFSAGQCAAGVIRGKSEDVKIVEISWPENMRRNLYFNIEGKISGADTAQADGSAAFEVKATRESDNTIVTIGPERYVIPDVLVLGD